MNAAEWIALGAAGVSVLSLIATVFFAAAAGRAAHLASSINMGQAETALRSAITATRQPVRQLAVEIASLLDGRRSDQLSAEEKRRLNGYELPFNEAVEDNLNAYETACAHYIDNKIDRQRFHRLYVREIQNLCECDGENPVHAFIHPEGSSKFQAIWKVYREWHHLEK
jgi:hypothetical protein